MPGIKNVLFIDIAVKEHKLFVESCNSVTFPVLYSKRTTRSEIIGRVSRIPRIERVAFVFHESGPFYKFLNNEPLFLEGSRIYQSVNVRFIVELLNTYNVRNVDFLACNTLQYSTWKDYYDVLGKHTKTLVGASDDKTGNLKYGGDWVMENTQENVRNVYFTSKIGDYSQLLAGFNTNTVLINGKVFVAGNGQFGQLGLGSWNSVNEFTEVSSLSGKTIVSLGIGGYHTLALDNVGKVYSAGLNDYGQLSVNNNVNNNTFVECYSNVKSVGCGQHHSMVVDNGGKVYGAGYNLTGELGIVGFTFRNNFTQVTEGLSGKNIAFVSCGGFHSVAVDNAGKMYVSGHGGYGQLGLGNYENAGTFTEVTSMSGENGVTSMSDKNIVSVSCGKWFTIAIDSNGKVYGTGANELGELGIGSITQRGVAYFTEVVSLSGKNIVSALCGENSVSVIDDSGKVYVTGHNNHGQLGLGNNINVSSFAEVTSLSGKNIISGTRGANSAVVLDNANKAYATGRNNYGQLGMRNSLDLNTFTLVQSLLLPFSAPAYEQEIASELTKQQTLSPSPAQLVSQSNTLVTDVRALIDSTEHTESSLLAVKDTVQGSYDTATSFKSFLEGYLNGINVVLALYSIYKQEMEGWLADDSISTTDKQTIQNSYGSLLTSGSALEGIKTDIENGIPSASNNITTLQGFSEEVDLAMLVVKSEGYATELSGDVTTNQSNFTNTQNLVNQSDSFIVEATSLVDTTFYTEQDLTSARNTVLTHLNTITSSVTTVQGHLTKIEGDIVKGNGYRTEIESWYQETNNASIQESLNSSLASLDSLTSIKSELETTLASLEANKETLTVLNTQMITIQVKVCFPGNTPITTDQGEININELIAGKHTIDGKQIRYITKVTSPDSTLTCIRRNAFDDGVPSRKTVMTNDHPVEFHGEMVPAGELVDLVEGVFNVRYNGEFLYNVVLEKKDTMMVNGLRCNTVNPQSKGLISLMMIERVRNERNPERKVKMAMAMRKVLRKIKLEDIRMQSERRMRELRAHKN